MPAWIHNRAKHIQAKNPSMPESQAFAIATQQAHAAGKSPKGYGTAEGRREAKKKYDKSPSKYTQTADPGNKAKTAGLVFLMGFSDELTKIAAVKPKKAELQNLKPTETPDALPPPVASAPGTI